MPKQKTHKGLRKRVKVTARGKVMVSMAGKSHLMTGTRGKDVRRLRGYQAASASEQKRLFKMLRQG
jgi:large subunit ribosomal protein L35